MALNNFIGKRKWKAAFEAGRDAADAEDFKAAETNLQLALEHAAGITEQDSSYGDTALMLGQVYRRMERYQESEQMTDKALRYYEGIFGATDPRTVQAHLAIVLGDPAKSHQDLDVRKATYELARTQFGDQSWQVIRTAALALESFSSQERETVLSNAQAACTAVLGEKRMELPTWPAVVEEFANALAEAEYGDLAGRFMGLQLRLHEERFGEKSQEASLTRVRLGDLFLANGFPQKAEVAFSRAIDSLKLKLGPNSAVVKHAGASLGRALAQQKKLGEAAPHLTDALEILNSTQTDERLEVLVALLEQKCLVAGTDSERGALWQELESFWKRTESDEERSKIFRGLLAAQRRLQQSWELGAADRFLHVVLARTREWRGPHHPDVAEVMMELCSCSLGSDDKPRAISFLEQSLALDEGVDNLIRAVACYGRLGDATKAAQTAGQAQRLLKSYEAGVELGRRQARLADSILHTGDFQAVLELVGEAEKFLPPSEQPLLQCTKARADVLNGRYNQAMQTLQSAVESLTDPFDRAKALLHLAWLQTRSGKFTEAKESLGGTEVLLQLRPDHPLGFQAKAVSSQIAFFMGQVFEGRELRKEVLDYLKSGRHEQSLRSLELAVLIEPFGAEEDALELEVGTQILAASEYPERNLSVFGHRDVACVGLQHVARALHLSGQESLATERLNQYRERFFGMYSPEHPVASVVHLTSAAVQGSNEDQRASLSAAVSGLRALAQNHVALFPALSKLTKINVALGDLDGARSSCQAALALRHSPKLAEMMESLQKGVLPVQEAEPEPQAEAPAAAESETVQKNIESEIPEGFEIDDEPPTAAPQEGVIAAGNSDLSELKLARFLSERAEAPSPEETTEFLSEVKARFGEEVQPNLEARVLLSLLFSDGAPEGQELWADALALVPENDYEGLMALENRARDASSLGLVIQTLQERLKRESARYSSENAVETLETQTRLAKAFEAKGQTQDAYRRMTLVVEILRSWFGARSRRLLEPLGELMRLAESLNDVHAAFEHQLERHRLLESADGDAEELFHSRVSLLPIRGRLGQMAELLEEAHICEQELVGFRSNATSEFVKVLLVAARRVDQLHWRSDVASTLLEIALRSLAENEISLGCRVRINLAECLYRKDYRSQAARVRDEALEKASSLEADARAEMLHMAAQSCLRIQEVELARKLAERVLEERIAQGGRKDIWAGRALLVLAEADLKTFRLEGTETAIGMSAPSLKGTRYWGKAQSLQLQALFFLNRMEEAYEILEEMPKERALQAGLRLAVWRGEGAEYVRQLEQADSDLGQLWEKLESIPLDAVVNILDFIGRVGHVRLLDEGLNRTAARAQAVLASDVRKARFTVLEACGSYWKQDWDTTASTLQRTIELLPEGYIEFPDGLSANLIREALLTCFLEEGRSTSALAQAQQGVAESAEVLGEEDIRSIVFKERLARCARALGQWDDALVLLDEILTPLQEILGETHFLLREVFRGLALTFLDQSDVESARLSAEEALRIDKECRGLSIHFLEDLELLSQVERKEDVPEAINLLDTALELAGQILPEEHPYEVRLRQKMDELSSQEHVPVPEEQPVAAEAEAESAEEESPEALFDESYEEAEEESTDDTEEEEAAEAAELAEETQAEEAQAEESEGSTGLMAAGAAVVAAAVSGLGEQGEDSAEALFETESEPEVVSESAEALFEEHTEQEPEESGEAVEVAEEAPEESVEEEAEEQAEVADGPEAEDAAEPEEAPEESEAVEVAEEAPEEEAEAAEELAEAESTEEESAEVEVAEESDEAVELAEEVPEESAEEAAEEAAEEPAEVDEEVAESAEESKEAVELAEEAPEESAEEAAEEPVEVDEEVAESAEASEESEEAVELAEEAAEEPVEVDEEVAESAEASEESEEAVELAEEAPEESAEEEAEEQAEAVEEQAEAEADEAEESEEVEEESAEAPSEDEVSEESDEAVELAEEAPEESAEEEAEEQAEAAEESEEVEEEAAEAPAEDEVSEESDEAVELAEEAPEESAEEEAEEQAEVAEESEEVEEEAAEAPSEEEVSEESGEAVELAEEAPEESAEEEAEEQAEVAEDSEEVEEEAAEELAEEEVSEESGEAVELAEEAPEESAEEEAEEQAEVAEESEEVEEEAAEELAEEEVSEESDEAVELAEEAPEESAEEEAEEQAEVAEESEEVEEEAAEAPAEDEVSEESDEAVELAEEAPEESTEVEAEEQAEAVEEQAEAEADEAEESEEVEEEAAETPAEEEVSGESDEAVEFAEDTPEESAEEQAEEESEEEPEEQAEELAEDDDDFEEESEESIEDAGEPSIEDTIEFGISSKPDIPRPYKVSAQSPSGTFVASSPVIESQGDFPEVPLRLPHISETEQEVESAESEALESASEEEVLESEDAAEDSQEVSLEDILEISDPESFMLPLAPLFFLPVPWKETTEAPFKAEFEEIHDRFQKAYNKAIGWREVVEEAVSLSRREPNHASGYFMYLLGAQLEKGGHLHTADVCLATAIELLESGNSLGGACHLAGRVAGRRGELSRALEYFDRSAEHAEESELAVLKIDAAECHLGLGRPEEALIGFEEVFDYLAENAPKVQALAVQAKMAQIHLLIGDPDSSQSLAEETLENLSPKNAGTYRVLGRILLSRAFARLGRHELALELAEKAWEGAKPWSAKRKDGRRIAISNLVDIYGVLGRAEEAQELVTESGLTGWGLAEAEVLLRAGHVACTCQNLGLARTYMRLGKSFLTRFTSPALWRSCFLELEAEVNLLEGEFEKASQICEKALDMFEQEATGPVDRSRHIVRAARIAGAKGDNERAMELIEQAHSLRDLHLGGEHPHTSSVEGLSAVLSGGAPSSQEE